MRCYIYVYKDASGVVRYVGKGSGNRHKAHISLARSVNEGLRLAQATDFTHWLAQCLRDGAEFSFELIQEGLSDEDAFALEKALISKHKRIREGGTLYNALRGGEGFSTAQAQRIQADPSFQARKSVAMRAAFARPESRDHLRRATKESNGRPHRRAQSREKALAEWQRPERREAAAKRAQELWADPEWSAKRRAELVERNKRKAT